MVVVEKTYVLDVFKEFDPKDVETGDVIVFQKNSTGVNEDIIHRVVAVNDSGGKIYYTVKGDNNTVEDQEQVLPDQVMGKAVNWGGSPITIPKIGWILIWIKGGLNQ